MVHARIVIEPMCGNTRAVALREHGGAGCVGRGGTPTTAAPTIGGVR